MIRNPEILQAATTVAARRLRTEGQIGTLSAGALAELLRVDGAPTASVDLWADPARSLRQIMQGAGWSTARASEAVS